MPGYQIQSAQQALLRDYYQVDGGGNFFVTTDDPKKENGAIRSSTRSRRYRPRILV